MIKPKKLQKGDLIAIAAPASPFDKKDFIAGVKVIQKIGYEVTFNKDIFSKKDYLAGSDARRAQELNSFFADPNVRAIFFARGGYGTQRILHLLDMEAIKAYPKIILGYSDITSLHALLYRHNIGGAFYGPTVVKHFRSAPGKTIDILTHELSSNSPLGELRIKGAKVQRNGETEGVLIGGCLSLITSSIGTPYSLPTEDTILFLEDVGEPVYKYDRLLTHLINAGQLRGVKGIIFGSLGTPKNSDRAILKRLIKEKLADFPGPIVTDIPTGHLPLDKLFVTLPLGVTARLRTSPLTLEILEPALL